MSRGAILRYLRPIQKPMWSLLVHRAEHFDPDVHKDAVATRTDNRSARTVPKKRARPLPKSNSPRYKWSVANLDIVKKDPLDGRPVVTERVLHILVSKQRFQTEHMLIRSRMAKLEKPTTSGSTILSSTRVTISRFSSRLRFIGHQAWLESMIMTRCGATQAQSHAGDKNCRSEHASRSTQSWTLF